jgi:prepilin-type N-terminal cleavage/methylation domain-containing protein
MKRLFNQSNTNGFTLVELLVVVLIIGILAAMAMPYYEKAVEQSRAAEAMTLLRAVYDAQELHRMKTGHYASKFESLSIKLPWRGKKTWHTSNHYIVMSNDLWSLQMGPTSIGYYVSIGRISGNYKGAGFMMYNESSDWRVKKGRMYCGECQGGGCAVPFERENGDYCSEIFATSTGSTYPGLIKLYTMP